MPGPVRWPSLLAITACLTAACQAPPERTSSSASAQASAPAVVEARVDRVTWSGAGLMLDDERVDAPPPDAPARMDGLFAALKLRREQWKELHPGAPFTSAVRLELPTEASCNGAASALQSIADAGYGDVTVRRGEQSQRVPPLSTAELAPLARGAARLFFRRDGEIEIFVRHGYAPVDVVPAEQLTAALAEWCGGAACLKQAQVFCERGAAFGPALAALVGLAAAQPQMALSFGREVAAQRPWSPAAAPARDVRPPLKRRARRAVRISSLTTSDNLTQGAVKPLLERQLDDLVACYQETAHMPAARLMKAELEIGKKGGVTNVTIRGDDLIDYDLDCLYLALAKTSLPAPGGGKSGLVSCGFAFTRSP